MPRSSTTQKEKNNGLHAITGLTIPMTEPRPSPSTPRAVCMSPVVVAAGQAVGLITPRSSTIIWDSSSGLARYNGTGNGNDGAAGIVIDSSGNVYVTGGSAASGGGFDYASIKYNSVRQQQWASRYRAPGSLGDFATAIAVSSSGNVYVTGQSSGDYGTIKYNSSGQE